ncbi:MAG: DUF1735 domain-containing protein [Clostridium sp.]|nr:DUF1735 domain-containing protein [Bacteroides sp.]MCM1197742.1 DUF1735 domain-containing protein [Clostridium sp.]
MKPFFKILSSLGVLCAMSSCSAELAPIIIHPDPVFDKTGVFQINTISIYDEQETVITVSRTYGLSKEVDMLAGIDETVLEEYNRLNGTDYKLMPEKYYDMPESLTLVKTSKTVELPVIIRPKALAEEAGLERANQYVIPISILSSSIELEEKGAASQVILKPNIVNPELNVIIPETNARLSFIKGVEIPQRVTISSHVNFTTVEPSRVTFVPDAAAVGTFNQKNGTDYRMLAEEYYTVEKGTLDEEEMNWSVGITLSCHNIQDENVYILPLRMSSQDYTVTQKEPVYILVQLNILKMWLNGSGTVITSNTGKGTVTAELNAPITAEQPADLVVDNTKVPEYNSANGTSYLSVDPSKVTITAGSILAGEKTASISYKVDMKDMEYDGEDKYLIPLVLSRKGLYTGTEIEGDFIYISPNKSLEIPYVKTVWGKELSNRVTKGEIYHSNLRPSKNAAKQKYAINYNQNWADGLIYFNILDEAVDGYPERLKLGDFLDRPYDYQDGCDPVIDNGSYIDTDTGIIHFDLTVMDYANAANGGFPIQIELTPAQ